ncbi:hypothetical protein O9K51_00210 [Purpureocillium lavendulum]|uniref:Uncharacterized protein n=1 Tax=Purpureocillium lavendulum TaxID=1247861 RepID=A0AB34G1Q3_9HYPO|nr:hypothetical protein O9K51_00210 [Purpureocillium lavendulum]
MTSAHVETCDRIGSHNQLLTAFMRRQICRDDGLAARLAGTVPGGPDSRLYSFNKDNLLEACKTETHVGSSQLCLATLHQE